MCFYHECHLHPTMDLDTHCHLCAMVFYRIVVLEIAVTTALEKGSCIFVLEGCILVVRKAAATSDFGVDYGKSSSIYCDGRYETWDDFARGFALEKESLATNHLSARFDGVTVCGHVLALIHLAQVGCLVLPLFLPLQGVLVGKRFFFDHGFDYGYGFDYDYGFD
jgi:hypothetical protein